MQLLINLPERTQQLAFNRSRWNELLADRSLAKLPYKIETNYSGQILMTPPPSGEHSRRQTRIVLQLAALLDGEPLAECPISTIDGVRTANVGWYSNDLFAQVRGQVAFERAPEICVEVISPGNTPHHHPAQLQHKRSLYFEAGAEEVWHCNEAGAMAYFFPNQPNQPQSNSPRCPNFPRNI